MTDPRPSSCEQAGPPDDGRRLDELDLPDLRRLLVSLPTIEQAKGIVMAYRGVDHDEAFQVLRSWSSVSNTKLRLLSAALVTAASQPCDQPFGGLQSFLGHYGLD